MLWSKVLSRLPAFDVSIHHADKVSVFVNMHVSSNCNEKQFSPLLSLSYHLKYSPPTTSSHSTNFPVSSLLLSIFVPSPSCFFLPQFPLHMAKSHATFTPSSSHPLPLQPFPFFSSVPHNFFGSRLLFVPLCLSCWTLALSHPPPDFIPEQCLTIEKEENTYTLCSAWE